MVEKGIPQHIGSMLGSIRPYYHQPTCFLETAHLQTIIDDTTSVASKLGDLQSAGFVCLRVYEKLDAVMCQLLSTTCGSSESEQIVNKQDPN